MTADEIRAVDHDNLEFGSANFLQEIAAQLAELNALLKELVIAFSKINTDVGTRGVF